MSCKSQNEKDCLKSGNFELDENYFSEKPGNEFILNLKNKKITGRKCKDCGKVFLYPETDCGKCSGEIQGDFVEVSDTGKVLDFKVIKDEKAGQPVKPPYILASIMLDGADTPFVHILRGIGPGELEKGQAVKASFARKPPDSVFAIECFRPVRPIAELGYSYDQLEVGMYASFSKTITETDVYLFAGISGDFNPMHLNEEFAKLTPFGTRIAHGALPQSLIANVLGMKLPGLGTVALEINTRFLGPTYFGDTVTASAEVIELLSEKKWVRLELRWTNQDGKLIGIGDALCIPPPSL